MPAPDQSSFYRPLRTDHYIRLLRRASDLNRKDDTPQFWLEEYDITQCPAFVAVSYTWSPPYFRDDKDSSENVDALFTTNIGIDCKPFAATQNMVEALNCVLSKSEINYIWMDGCCINQASKAEKAVQVGMMHQIYEAASLVIAWLGGKHPCARDLQWITNEFANLALETAKDWGYQRTREASPSGVAYLAGLDERKFDDTLKAAVHYYRSCRYFERTWVRQEVVLAKQLRMFCDDFEISFEGLGLISTLSHRLWSLDSQRSHDSLPVRRDVSFGSFGVWYRFNRSYTKGESSIISSSLANPTLPYVHDLTETSATLLGTWHIISRLQATICSDPRDKIYAALPLAARMFSGNVHVQRFIVPTYQSPVEEIYTSFCKTLIEGTGCLTILALMGDRSERLLQLPSWVHDFSARNNYKLAERFSGRAYQIKIRALALRRGIRFTANKLVSFGTPFAVINRTTSIDKTNPWPGNYFTSLLGLIANGTKFINGVPRIEALWRTLVCDAIRMPHNIPEDTERLMYPAPASIADQFHHWLISGLAGTIEQRLKQGETQESIARSLRPVLDQFKGEHNARSPWIYQAFMTHELMCVPATDQEDLDHRLWQQMRHDSSEFSDRMTESNAMNRSVFRAKEGFIGSGPQDAQPGDQVWFVHSCSAPLLLRPVAVENSYTLIGSCYLHGFMFETKMFDPEYDFVSKWRKFTLI